VSLIELLKKYAGQEDSSVLANGQKVVRWAEWSDGSLTVQVSVEGEVRFFVFEKIGIPADVVFDKNGEFAVYEKASGHDIIFVVLTTSRYLGEKAAAEAKARDDRREFLVRELQKATKELGLEIQTQTYLKKEKQQSDKADRCLQEAFERTNQLVEALFVLN
jgi:hypothetical protein